MEIDKAGARREGGGKADWQRDGSLGTAIHTIRPRWLPVRRICRCCIHATSRADRILLCWGRERREGRKGKRRLLEGEIPTNSLEKSDGLADEEDERDQNLAQDVQGEAAAC